MRPKFQGFADHFDGQNLSSGNMDRIKRPDIHTERTLRAVDDKSINRGEVQHSDEVRKFFAFDCRLCIVEIAKQPLAIDGPEGLHFGEFGRYRAIAGGEAYGWSGFCKQHPEQSASVD